MTWTTRDSFGNRVSHTSEKKAEHYASDVPGGAEVFSPKDGDSSWSSFKAWITVTSFPDDNDNLETETQ